MSALRDRTVEISAEYWEAREEITERLAVAQLALALAQAEQAAATPSGDDPGRTPKVGERA